MPVTAARRQRPGLSRLGAAVCPMGDAGHDAGIETQSPETLMTLLLLEALGAFVLLIFIVWWTMFSGRKNGELHDEVRQPEDASRQEHGEPPAPRG